MSTDGPVTETLPTALTAFPGAPSLGIEAMIKGTDRETRVYSDRWLLRTKYKALQLWMAHLQLAW